MYRNERFAIVITHLGRRKGIVEAPWLETEYRIDGSDWIILSEDTWRAVADGDPTIWRDLERKLMVGCYVKGPQFVVVIGHPADAGDADAVERRRAGLRRIVRRVRSLLLPAGVMGIWTDERGRLPESLEPAKRDERAYVEREPVEVETIH